MLHDRAVAMFSQLTRRTMLAGVVAYTFGCGAPAAQSGPQVLATLTHPTMLAIHGSRVYVAQDQIAPDAAIWSFAVEGGNRQRIATGVCGGLAVDATFLFWTNRLESSVGRAELADALSTKTFGGASFAGRGPGEIASDGSRIFWADVTGGEIRSAAIDGTDARVLVSLQNQPTSLVIGGAHVYWATYEPSGKIMRARRDGADAMPEALISELPMPNALALNATHVYWIDGQFIERRIMRAALDGGAAETLATASGPISLALDDRFAYWGESSGPIRRIPLAGGPAVVIADQQKKPIAIAVDATHVYWANFDGDNVARIAKSELP